MIFTEQEQLSRRQFHELFCTKYLYTGKRKGALNEESWTADTLYDILRVVYTDNQLTPQDIEAILHVGGMFDADGNLFFHYRADTPIIKEILYAMSPFITNAAFIRCKQKLSSDTTDSVAAFVVRCCTNPEQGNEKILIKELYEYYTNWCVLNAELAVSKKVFSRRLSEIGFRIKKGYLNGNSGVLHVIIKLDKEAANTSAKPQRTQTEEKAELECATALRDVDGTGAKVLEDLIKAATSSLPEDEGREDVTTGGRGSNRKYAEDDGSDNATVSDGEEPAFDGSADEDDFDWGADDSDSEDGDDALGEVVAARAREVMIPEGITTKEEAEAFIKTLPYNIRTAFKQMKITYRISPDSVNMHEFELLVRSLGIVDNDVEKMFHVFVLYAERLGGE